MKQLLALFFIALIGGSVVEATWCSTCVDFMGQAIDQLLNIIANVGILGSCDKLCGYLNNTIEKDICNVLCDAVGIDVFIHLIEDADPDPVWLCEELHVCKYNDSANGALVSFSVSPQTGHRGEKFTFSVVFQTDPDFGTGQVCLNVLPPDGEPLGDGVLLDSPAPNTYEINFSLVAKATQDDPFGPGVYQAFAELWLGGCGSTHVHARQLAQLAANFTLTN